jgi:hypothetical protein
VAVYRVPHMLTKSEAEVSDAPIVEQFAIGSFGPIG